MSLPERRLDAATEALTARERAVLLLRDWLEGSGEVDRLSRGSTVKRLGVITLAVAVVGSVALFGLGHRIANDEPGPAPGLAYAEGACQVERPARGNNHLIVFLDPGHGGPDPGTSGTTGAGDPIDEKTATLAVAMDLAKLLSNDGYTVVLSRTTDSSVVRLAPGDLNQDV